MAHQDCQCLACDHRNAIAVPCASKWHLHFRWHDLADMAWLESFNHKLFGPAGIRFVRTLGLSRQPAIQT